MIHEHQKSADLPLFTMARTKRSHPPTAHAAAKRANLSASSTARKVLEALSDGQPRTDEQIYAAMNASPFSSSPRARRSDLVQLGLVAAHDESGITSSGCRATRWVITKPGMSRLEAGH